MSATKIKVKRSVIISMYDAIEQLPSLQSNGAWDGEFTYGVNKTKLLIKNEVDSSLAILKKSDELVKYEQELFGIQQKYCEKDDKGNPITIKIDNNRFRYSGLGNNKKFESEFKKLNEKYKDALSSYAKQEEEYSKMIEKEIEVEVWKIERAFLPKINVEIVGALMPIIEE